MEGARPRCSLSWGKPSCNDKRTRCEEAYKTMLSAQLFMLSQLPPMEPTSVPQDVADRFGAKQLNGDPPIYDVRLSRSGSSSWLLFLEGGGWCFGPTQATTIASCAARAGFLPPSDTPLTHSSPLLDMAVHRANTADYGGILSANCTTNPKFCGWNHAFLHYRDGASFGSNRSEPIAVRFKNGTEGALLWMRGRPSFDAMIHDLRTRHGMADATEVILSGGSAGGLAVYYNLDHLAELLRAVGSTARLTGFPDAGFFLDHEDIGGAHSYRASFIGADPVWHITATSGTNAACLAAQPPSERWRCLMAPYIAPHLETPTYAMNSAFDAWQIPHILGETACAVSTVGKPCNDSLVQAYGVEFRSVIGRTLLTKAQHGAYVDSCWVHEQNVNYCSNQDMPNCVGWTPASTGSEKWGYRTSVEGLTPQQAFSRWYFEGAPAASRVLIDSAALQKNPTCIFRGHPVRVPG
jgi:hypothetical protein